MKGKTAIETLNYLIDLLLCYLDGFSKKEKVDISEFISGERTAYVECLEVLQLWKNAGKYGLNFNIETRFPI